MLEKILESGPLKVGQDLLLDESVCFFPELFDLQFCPLPPSAVADPAIS
jgi:hypothetical protein